MRNAALMIVRLARYVLRLTAEAEKEGRDATAYRGAVHRLVVVLRRLMSGDMSPGDLAPLVEFLDKFASDGKMDGGPGSGNHGHKGVPGQVGGSAPASGGSGGSGSSSGQSSGTEPGGSSSSGGGSSSVPSSGSASPTPSTGGMKKPKVKPTHFKREGDTVEVTEDTKIKTKDRKKTTMTVGKITDVYDFAGGSAKKPVEKEDFLIDQYGGKPGSWRHSAENAQVKSSKGKAKTVEVHWFENDEVGQTGWKVKHWKPHKKGGSK